MVWVLVPENDTVIGLMVERLRNDVFGRFDTNATKLSGVTKYCFWMELVEDRVST